MTSQEAKLHSERVIHYTALEASLNKAYDALKALSNDGWKETGPCGQGPFTGNTRESRQVISMSIKFSATRGGAEPVSQELENLNIEAWDFGKAVESMLRKRIEIISKEMDSV